MVYNITSTLVSMAVAANDSGTYACVASDNVDGVEDHVTYQLYVQCKGLTSMVSRSYGAAYMHLKNASSMHSVQSREQQFADIHIHCSTGPPVQHCQKIAEVLQVVR